MSPGVWLDDIGPDPEWRREFEGRSLAPPWITRATLEALACTLGPAAPRPPRSTQGGRGRALLTSNLPGPTHRISQFTTGGRRD